MNDTEWLGTHKAHGKVRSYKVSRPAPKEASRLYDWFRAFKCLTCGETRETNVGVPLPETVTSCS